MTVTTPGDTAIRPLTGEIPQADLDDLRARVAATRFPEKETVDDLSQGPPLATMRALARYWAEEYDFRKCEEKLDALPHFVTEIDGLDIHFIHVRSEHEDAMPLIVTHGWPGSIVGAAEDHRSTDQSDGAWCERIGCVSSGDPVDAGLRTLG